jgi:hypothetical protein
VVYAGGLIDSSFETAHLQLRQHGLTG